MSHILSSVVIGMFCVLVTVGIVFLIGWPVTILVNRILPVDYKDRNIVGKILVIVLTGISLGVLYILGHCLQSF